MDAIELLNEVARFLGSAWDSAVRGYWESGYEVMRQAAGDNVVVVIGDAFEDVDVRDLTSKYCPRYQIDVFTSRTL